MIFVHSLAGNARQWSMQTGHLRKVRRAVAFDLRGHGRSDLPSIRVSGTGHWLQMDRPEEFNRILDQFLAGLGEGETSAGGRGI